MERYYDTTTGTETHVKSNTTIISTDERVAHFFKPLKEGFRLSYDNNNLPIIEYIKTDNVAINPKIEGETYTLNGVDYQVPFTKDDADGVMQVSFAFQLGITETVIYFTNGTKMPIIDVEFQEFVIWYVTRRNEFFLNKGGK